MRRHVEAERKILRATVTVIIKHLPFGGVPVTM